MEYTMIQIGMENCNEIATEQKKGKTKEGWLNCPEKVPYFRDSWCHAELYNKPIDWREQENAYDRKMVTYKQKKQEYDELCAHKLSLTTDIEDPTSKEKEESEELEKCKANKERFLKFAYNATPTTPHMP
jgi:hypothetical protein